MYILGASRQYELSELEKRLLSQSTGGTFTHCVRSYPKLVLSNRRLVIAKERCRSEKRNNSCVVYNCGAGRAYGVVKNILVSTSSDCYIVMKKLEPASLVLCHDELTHADLQVHYKAFLPPRFVHTIN